MKIVSQALVSLLFAFWLSVFSVFSIQNITEVSVKFLYFESIKLPVGVLLAFCFGIGVLLAAFAPLFWQKNPKSRRKENL